MVRYPEKGVIVWLKKQKKKGLLCGLYRNGLDLKYRVRLVTTQNHRIIPPTKKFPAAFLVNKENFEVIEIIKYKKK